MALMALEKFSVWPMIGLLCGLFFHKLPGGNSKSECFQVEIRLFVADFCWSKRSFFRPRSRGDPVCFLVWLLQ